MLSFFIGAILFIVLPPALKIFVWTMFFLLGLVVAIVVRLIITKMGKSHLLCNGINGRISNTLVDFLVCGTFISIQIGSVAQYVIPFFASTIIYTVTIAIALYWYCSKLKEEDVQTFAFVFGNVTGTVSTAFVLLRLVDPDNKSQVPIMAAYGNILSVPMAIILPAIMHMEPIYGLNPWYAVGAALAVVAVMFIVTMIFRQPQNDIAWKPE